MDYLKEQAAKMAKTAGLNENMFNDAKNMLSKGITDNLKPDEILPAGTEHTTLASETKQIVNESTEFMTDNIFTDASFNIITAINHSLLSHVVVKDSDEAKYDVMKYFVDRLFDHAKTVVESITENDITSGAAPAQNPMFGGADPSDEVKEVLSNLKFEKTIYSETIKDTIIAQTKTIINTYLSHDNIRLHIESKFKPKIEEQLKKIYDQIKNHTYQPIQQTAQMFGGTQSVHFLLSKAVEELKKKYIEEITKKVSDDDLKNIMAYSLIQCLNIPASTNTDEIKAKIRPCIEHMVVMKDTISKKAIKHMKLDEKIGHIMKYIDDNPELEKNLLDCIKNNISADCVNSNIFTPVFGANATCVQNTLNCIIQSTQNKNISDQINERGIEKIVSLNTTKNQNIPDLSYSAQTLDETDEIKHLHQSQVVFAADPNTKSDEEQNPVISREIWEEVISDKINKITTVDNDGEIIKNFIELYIGIYAEIDLLPNQGLFLLFNDPDVMEKINSCLMLFGDFVYNTDLATCNNPAALMPEMAPTGEVNIVPPPKRPDDITQMSELILFLFKHHMRHYSSGTKQSVGLNEHHNALIYQGFESEFKEFKETKYKDDKRPTTLGGMVFDTVFERFTELIFRKYMNELKNKVYKTDLETINTAINEYKTQMQMGGMQMGVIHTKNKKPKKKQTRRITEQKKRANALTRRRK